MDRIEMGFQSLHNLKYLNYNSILCWYTSVISKVIYKLVLLWHGRGIKSESYISYNSNFKKADKKKSEFNVMNIVAI